MTLAMVKVLPEPVTPRRTWWDAFQNPLAQHFDGLRLVALG